MGHEHTKPQEPESPGRQDRIHSIVAAGDTDPRADPDIPVTRLHLRPACALQPQAACVSTAGEIPQQDLVRRALFDCPGSESDTFAESQRLRLGVGGGQGDETREDPAFQLEEPCRVESLDELRVSDVPRDPRAEAVRVVAGRAMALAERIRRQVALSDTLHPY